MNVLDGVDIQRTFLPVALEVQEQPPSPTARILGCLLAVLFAAGVIWASFGEVDIVVTAPGRIVPIGQVKLVQARDGGTVADILVRDGDRVEAGQALIHLDRTYADADTLRIRRQLNDVSLQISWRRELALWLATGKFTGNAIGSAALPSMRDEDRAQALYTQHRAEISARIGILEQERAATRSEQSMARAEREKIEATLAILNQRVAAYKSLVEQKYGARMQYLELVQAQTELTLSIPVLQARERQLENSTGVLAARVRATLGEQRKSNLLELARLGTEKSSLEQELRKVELRQHQQVLTARVTGKVQQLATHTIGGVVRPAQELMKIVPENATVEVEALLPNKDVGFVKKGQSVAVKVNTFNFTKYGLIAAKVANISDDAVEDKQLGWVFKMRLTLSQDQIAVENQMVKLSPGMAITAEIKTGKRRLIEFFLSPLLRYRQESVRER